MKKIAYGIFRFLCISTLFAPALIGAQQITPPQLLSPTDGKNVKPEEINFFWTPAYGISKSAFKYKLVIYAKGSNTYEYFIEHTDPVYEVLLKRTSFAYPDDAPRLDQAEKYFWYVAVVNNEGGRLIHPEPRSEYGFFEIIFVPELLVETPAVQMTGLKIYWDSFKTSSIQMTGFKLYWDNFETPSIKMTGTKFEQSQAAPAEPPSAPDTPKLYPEVVTAPGAWLMNTQGSNQSIDTSLTEQQHLNQQSQDSLKVSRPLRPSQLQPENKN